MSNSDDHDHGHDNEGHGHSHYDRPDVATGPLGAGGVGAWRSRPLWSRTA